MRKKSRRPYVARIGKQGHSPVYTDEEYAAQNAFIDKHYNKGMSAREIANYLGIPRNTVIMRGNRRQANQGRAVVRKSIYPQRIGTTQKKISLPRISILEDPT